MLTDASGNPIPSQVCPKEDTPSVGHSISAASTRTLTKGSTSPEGASSNKGGTTNSAYAAFVARTQDRFTRLKKANATDEMVSRLLERLDYIHRYMQDETFFTKLEDARLRDIVQAETWYVEKLQQLNGSPSYIMAPEHQAKVDQLLPALMEAIKQRGLTMTATERKIEVQAS